jgi:predicted ribosome quality control (RQC) complex YloA/Tae2 family protein
MNAKLLNQITANLTPLDTEELYADMLDECYPDCEIAGMSFTTSRALKELDPTAFRCGEVDYIDSLSLVEIDGDYYEQDAVEAEREGLIEELESEVSDLEDEISELDACAEEIGEIQEKIEKLTAEIEEIKNFVF